jgi:hypothetical protein
VLLTLVRRVLGVLLTFVLLTLALLTLGVLVLVHDGHLQHRCRKGDA